MVRFEDYRLKEWITQASGGARSIADPMGRLVKRLDFYLALSKVPNLRFPYQRRALRHSTAPNRVSPSKV